MQGTEATAGTTNREKWWMPFYRQASPIWSWWQRILRQERGLRREVSIGQRMPCGYGIAWRCWNRSVAICYPVPFHLLLRWLRDAYILLIQPSEWEWLTVQHVHALQMASYIKGREDGERAEEAQKCQAQETLSKALQATADKLAVQPQDVVLIIESPDSKLTHAEKGRIVFEFNRLKFPNPILFLPALQAVQVCVIPQSTETVIVLRSLQGWTRLEEAMLAKQFRTHGYPNPIAFIEEGQTLFSLSASQMKSFGWVRAEEATQTFERIVNRHSHQGVSHGT